MANRRVVVTGGCGFIGAHLCEALVARGDTVTILDNLSLGMPANLSAAVARCARISVVDVRDPAAVARCLQDDCPRIVYHLAAVHFIPACDADPLTCIRLNVEGTQAVLEACRAVSSIEAIVLASSAAVYRPSEAAHDEESVLGPTDIYGLSKLWMEQLADLFHRTTDISVGVARLFNVFGPGETNAHLIPSIIWQAQRGNDLHLGNLATRRDYIFVDDVVRALMQLADVCQGHGSLTCNVGSERAVAGERLTQAIERLLERRRTTHTDPKSVRKSDRPLMLSNCRRAHDLLSWRAETTLEDGLRAALQRLGMSGAAFP